MPADIYKNVDTHARDLGSGRVLAPGEVAIVDPDDPHDAAQIAAGFLRQLQQPAAQVSEPLMAAEAPSEPPAEPEKAKPRKRAARKHTPKKES